MAPRRSPRDSWGEMSTSSSCTSGGDRGEECCVLGKVSRFELMAHSSTRLQHISPKVFPSGSPTANSPASAVLGPSRASPVPHTNGINPRATPTLSVPHSNGISIRSRSSTPTNVSPLANGNVPRSVTPNLSSKQMPNRTPVGTSRSVTSSPAFDRSIHSSDRSMGSTRSLSGSNDTSSALSRTSETGASVGYRLITPSPAFNRNPLPYSPGSAFRSVTPSPPRSASVGPLSTPVGHRRTMSAGNGEIEPLRGSFTSSNCSSLEELNARNDELEQKRKQVRIILLNILFHAPMGRFQLELILFLLPIFQPSSH